jgi:hypothetical protein
LEIIVPARSMPVAICRIFGQILRISCLTPDSTGGGNNSAKGVAA